MADVRVLALIDDLRRLPAETAWVEFKENNTDSNVIGKLISALSNSARVEDRDFGYVVWGVRDGDHAVAGTRFDPDSSKRQGQSLAFWLSRRLRPDVVFSFKTIPHPEGRLVLLEVPAATTAPVEFDRTAYIRIGSATPRLADYPERQKALWNNLRPYAWETGIARQFIDAGEVLDLLDHASCFELTRAPRPESRESVLAGLQRERLNRTRCGREMERPQPGRDPVCPRPRRVRSKACPQGGPLRRLRRGRAGGDGDAQKGFLAWVREWLQKVERPCQRARTVARGHRRRHSQGESPAPADCDQGAPGECPDSPGHDDDGPGRRWSCSGAGWRSSTPALPWWSRHGSSTLRPGRATRRWPP